ncbi:MAG: hypothetical protein GF334_05410 [Candidatus Altiarchaeales archaeon]|nr:hypothetical protein [Candidatus Altiarchaeales archaeon]
MKIGQVFFSSLYIVSSAFSSSLHEGLTKLPRALIGICRVLLWGILAVIAGLFVFCFLGYISIGLLACVRLDDVAALIADANGRCLWGIPLEMYVLFFSLGMFFCFIIYELRSLIKGLLPRAKAASRKIRLFATITSRKIRLFATIKDGGYFKVLSEIPASQEKVSCIAHILPTKNPDAIHMLFLAGEKVDMTIDTYLVRGIDDLMYCEFEPISEHELLLHAWYPYMTEAYRKVLSGERDPRAPLGDKN